MNTREKALLLAALSGAGFAGLYAYAWQAARRFEDLEPETAEPPGSFLEVDGGQTAARRGVRLHYVTAGQPGPSGGEPVLLIHGFGASTFSFRHTIPELSQHFRTVALDLKGFGYSDRPAGGDYSLTAQAELVATFMERLGIPRAAVVGHSMGGAVAMRLAIASAERVWRLVLVDSATDRELRLGLGLARLLRPLLPVAALFTLHSGRFRRLSLRSAVHDPAHLTPEVLEGYFRPARMKGHLRSLGAFFVARRADEPLDPGRIRQPTLILWGEHDRWLPPARGEELARRIPQARLVLIPSAGHLPLEEQPALSNRALLDFLRAEEPARLET